MARFFVLNQEEVDELVRQHPATARDSGFQNFIVRVQGQYRKGTQEIRLDDEDIEFAVDDRQSPAALKRAAFVRTLRKNCRKEFRRIGRFPQLAHP